MPYIWQNIPIIGADSLAQAPTYCAGPPQNSLGWINGSGPALTPRNNPLWDNEVPKRHMWGPIPIQPGV